MSRRISHDRGNDRFVVLDLESNANAAETITPCTIAARFGGAGVARKDVQIRQRPVEHGFIEFFVRSLSHQFRVLFGRFDQLGCDFRPGPSVVGARRGQAPYLFAINCQIHILTVVFNVDCRIKCREPLQPMHGDFANRDGIDVSFGNAAKTDGENIFVLDGATLAVGAGINGWRGATGTQPQYQPHHANARDAVSPRKHGVILPQNRTAVTPLPRWIRRKYSLPPATT